MLKSIGGGIVGGLLGGMLFRSLGFGGGMGGGILQLIIFAAIGYFVFKFIRNRMNTSRGTPAAAQQPLNHGKLFREDSAPSINTAAGMPHTAPSFDERSFKDSVMDMFFRIQAAWMNRDLSPVSDILEDKMRSFLQDDISRLISDKKINRLENIAVRSVDITESWNEGGYDCITARIYATILDYTIDERNGEVIEGSKTEPVKFEELWTFEKSSGGSGWQLSAINQL
jgi:predicted lipid-binding transport protein (Tim44 family)